MELFKIAGTYIKENGERGHRRQISRSYKSPMAAIHAITAFRNSSWHNSFWCDLQIEHYYREPPKETPPPKPSIMSKILGYLNLNTGEFKQAI